MNQYRRTATAPVLPIAPSPIAVTGHKRKLVGNAGSVAIPRRETSPAQLAPVAEPQPSLVIGKPSDYWKSLLNEWNIPILDTVGIEQDENAEKNVDFLETTSERVEAYQSIELLTAVRRRDMNTLKRIALEKRSRGETMNACNRFGESILHLACRKGSLDVVELLVGSDCDCSLLVRDDYGRTVLHDACWTINPPWELLKLILKKAPALWRVSDIRGHLAIQYVPKSAWPQWSAFLSKNKGLLQRIMVHSYHQIDIMQQQPPAGQALTQHQQQEQAVQQEPSLSQGSSTNDTSAVPSQNLPQHQQEVQQQTIPQQQQHISMPLPTPASRPVSTHNSEERLHSAVSTTEVGSAVATQAPQQQHSAPVSAAEATQAAVAKRSEAAQKMATSALSLCTGGGAAGTSAVQAQNVLARALAQANPAMVKAISQGQMQQQGQLKQGLSRFPPSATAAAPPKVEPAIPHHQQQHASPAPGPATAALDEALRAQSTNRSKSRSNLLLTEQHPHKEPSKEEEKLAPKTSNEDSSQAPLPYAPSISMIAARLKGYQKNNTAAAVTREESQPSAVQSPPQEQLPINPLPAVPNPLLGILSEGESNPPMKPENGQQQQQQGAAENSLSNPIATARCQEQDVSSDGGNSNHSSNSVSSVTMSASPSLVEENGSDTTMNNSTDSDSDRAVTSSSSNPESEDATASQDVTAAEVPRHNSEGGEGTTIADDNDNKPSVTASEKIIVG